MNYTTTTYEPTNIPNDIKQDIINLIDYSIELGQDDYRENYKYYNFNSQKFITVQYNTDGDLCLFSSVYNREFYGSNTYRILNRLMRHPNRRLNGAKTNNGSQPSHEMLEQQIKAVEDLDADFYFISRQKNNYRWLNFYIEEFNRIYNRKMIVSDKKYWICSNYDSPEGCAQFLIYPETKNNPFELYS